MTATQLLDNSLGAEKGGGDRGTCPQQGTLLDFVRAPAGEQLVLQLRGL